MKKKKTPLILVLVFSFILIFSCGTRVIRRTRRVKDTSLARVLVRRKIIIAVDKNFPPYVTYGNNGLLTGFDIEIARAVAKDMNIDIEFRPMTWQNMIDSLYKKEIDCLWSAMSVSDFENISCILSDTYMMSSLTIMVPSDSIYTSVEELSDKNVGLLNLSSTASAASTIRSIMKNFANLQVYNDFSIAIDALKRKNIDALVLDIFSIFHLINSNEDMQIFNEPLNRMFYAVVFNKEDVRLRDRINESLLKLEYEGVLADISRKWFGSDILIIGK